MGKKLILTGTQGSGKSTILNYFKEKGYNVITEVVRTLAKDGVKINEMGDVEGQRRIFNEYVKLFSENESYISDRGLSDVTGYTFSHAIKEGDENGPLRKLADEQFLAVEEFHKNNPDITVCYVPIEFPVVDDGVRSTNEEFRSEIDFLIKNILDCANIPYHTITGTVEERINKVKKLLE